MTILILALLFLFSSLNLAHGQEDYFPPAGIYIPCCYGNGTGHTGATYGRNGSSAWRQVWGAQPGDVVTFQFALRTASAGSLHAWPKAANWIDPEYLGDPGNPYQKWYWNTGRRESGGTFCLDCLWRFTVPPGYYNPWIWIDYWDSGDGWDVDLNVVNIQTPVPTSWFSVLIKPDKDTAGQRATALAGASWAFTIAAPMAYSNPPLAGIFGVLAYATDKESTRLKELAKDPWDGNYCSPTEYGWDWQFSADVEWAYPYDHIASGGWLIYSSEVIHNLGNQAQTAIDRALTAAQDGNMDCAWARRSEAIQVLNGMGWYFWSLRWAVGAQADYWSAQGEDVSSMYNVIGELEYTAMWLGGLQ